MFSCLRRKKKEKPEPPPSILAVDTTRRSIRNGRLTEGVQSPLPALPIRKKEETPDKLSKYDDSTHVPKVPIIELGSLSAGMLETPVPCVDLKASTNINENSRPKLCKQDSVDSYIDPTSDITLQSPTKTYVLPRSSISHDMIQHYFDQPHRGTSIPESSPKLPVRMSKAMSNNESEDYSNVVSIGNHTNIPLTTHDEHGDVHRTVSNASGTSSKDHPRSPHIRPPVPIPRSQNGKSESGINEEEVFLYENSSLQRSVGKPLPIPRRSQPDVMHPIDTKNINRGFSSNSLGSNEGRSHPIHHVAEQTYQKSDSSHSIQSHKSCLSPESSHKWSSGLVDLTTRVPKGKAEETTPIKGYVPMNGHPKSVSKDIANDLNKLVPSIPKPQLDDLHAAGYITVLASQEPAKDKGSYYNVNTEVF